MLFWEIDSFKEEQKRVAKAAFVVVLSVNYCFLLIKILVRPASHVPRENRTSLFSM